jgi:hypothetical protein
MTLLGFCKDPTGMYARTRNPGLTPPALLAALIAACLLLGFSATSAGATATTTDSVVSIPLGKLGAGFRAKGVRVRAVSPAKIAKGELRLKATDIAVSSATSANVVLRGGLTLKRAGKSLKIRGLMIRARGNKVSLTGKVGARRMTVLSGSSRATLVQSEAQQVVAPAIDVRLSTKASRVIRSALKLRKTPSTKLGKLIVIAKADLPRPGGPGEAVLQDLAGVPIARPGGAVDVSLSSLRWWMRDSWVNYIEFNLPQDGATLDPPLPNSGHVCQDTEPKPGVSRSYALNLPFKSGWWDAASQTGYFSYSGAVRWYYPERGIDLTASNAEIEINGASSRLIFTIYDAAENTLKRGAFLALNTATLDLGGAVSRLKSTIFLDAATSPFGNFVSQYSSNPGWGCVDLGFTA